MKFELFGRLKDKGDDNSEQQPSSGQEAYQSTQQDIPVSEIQQLTEQGLSDNEIINELRDRGYAYQQINRAMNNMVHDEATGQAPQQPQGPAPAQQPAPAQGQAPAQMQQQAPPQGQQQPPQPVQQPQQGQAPAPEQAPPPEEPPAEGDVWQQQDEVGEEAMQQQPPQQAAQQQGYEEPLIPENTEEMIEVMISEKLIDVEDHFEQVDNRVSELEEGLASLQEEVKELKVRKDEDEKQFLGKVEELEQHLEASSGRIGGLEKALQQVLPTLVENVKDLTAMMKDMQQQQEGVSRQ